MSISIVAMDNQSSSVVRWGHAESVWGSCLVAGCQDDLCWLDIAPGASAAADLAEHFSHCDRQRDDAFAQTLLDTSLRALQETSPLQLRVMGTDFQRQVWQALTDIAPGEHLSYGRLAARLGSPGAARAVGTAAGANKIALFIPCHRLVPAAGGTGNYRWGAALKQRLLAAEQRAA